MDSLPAPRQKAATDTVPYVKMLLPKWEGGSFTLHDMCTVLHLRRAGI
jgi:hypothetical protein